MQNFNYEWGNLVVKKSNNQYSFNLKKNGLHYKKTKEITNITKSKLIVY